MAQFKKGESGNPKGGKPGNKGGGRPPEWFRERCRELSSSEVALKFLADVIAGEPIEERTVAVIGGQAGIQEQKALVTPTIKDRISAWEKVTERGFGKAVQPHEVTDIEKILEEMRKKYGSA